MRKAIVISLSEKDRITLTRWSRGRSTQARLVDRANVVLLAADGLQNKEIAQKLGISLATVRNHIHNILEKLDVHSKLEAVSLAFRQGWVQGPNGELEFGPGPFARP
jgi:DNA-binding NarL/FixJ family response regulator